MNPEVQQLFVDAAGDETRPRSRLEPYREQILLWRKRGRTYKRIRQTLREKCGVTVAHATLFNFVQRRSRPRKAQPEVQAAEPAAVAADPVPSAQPDSAPRHRLSLEERIAQRDAIRAAFANKPAVPREDPRPVFTFDPSKPPTNKNYEQGGKSGDSNSSN